MTAVGKIIVFDVETTGTDRRRDQVIELCVQFGIHTHDPARAWRFKPKVPISAGAQAVHGISIEDLADCPPFRHHAHEIRRIFDNAAVLVGYNISFDIEMLQAEYARLREPLLDLSGRSIVDAFRLWQQCEPRSLQDAHKRFVGSEFSAAHSASADVAATGRVLSGMLSKFGLPPDWKHIADVCEPGRSDWIGPSLHIKWNEDGVPVIAFGRHTHASIPALAAGPDRGYLEWIVAKDFPIHVREIAHRVLTLEPEAFEHWIRNRYGDTRPESVAAEALADARTARAS